MTPMCSSFSFWYMAARLGKSPLESLFTPKPPLEESGLTMMVSRLDIKSSNSFWVALPKSSHWRPMYLPKVV